MFFAESIHNSMNVSLAYDGEFGFKATLSLNEGKENADTGSASDASTVPATADGTDDMIKY